MCATSHGLGVNLAFRFCVSMCIVVWSALALLLLALRSIIPRLLASDLEAPLAE